MHRRTFFALVAASALPDWWTQIFGNDDDSTLSNQELTEQLTTLGDDVSSLDEALEQLAMQQRSIESRVEDLEAQSSDTPPIVMTYTGNGSTTGREIDVGMEPSWAVIQRDGSSTAEKYEATRPGLNVALRILGGSLSDSIEVSSEVYVSQNGVTVGDGGDGGNIDGVDYHIRAHPREIEA